MRDAKRHRSVIQPLGFSMMKWQLAQVAGIKIFVHWTFWLIPTWIVLATDWSQLAWPAVLVILLLFCGVFGSVVLHELGHALTARALGISTHHITLYPIGGVAFLERMPRRPSHELAITFAGPAVNLVLAALLFALWVLINGSRIDSKEPFWGAALLPSLLVVNIGMAAFNLLPLFPMDGGRVLRALLAMRCNHAQATYRAVRISQYGAVLLALVGAFGIPPWLPPQWMLIPIGGFVFLAAGAEMMSVRWQAQHARSDVYSDPAGAGRPPTDRDTQSRRPVIWVTEIITAEPPSRHSQDGG